MTASRSVFRLLTASTTRQAGSIKLAQRVLPHFSTSASASVTGGVSQQPGSKNFTELGRNAKEEAGAMGSVLAETISASKGHGHEGGMQRIKNDISSMAVLSDKIPQNALLAGAAGLVPYAGTSLATIYLSRQAGLSVSAGEGTFDAETALALLHHVELLQMQYGAIILSFLGAVHWGFEFAGYGGFHRNRYLLGIAPVLAGWGTLLLPGQVALAGQFGAFTAMWWADQRATTAGWTPRWYSTYRFWLTAFVGSSLVLTLGAANYFGPGSNSFRTTGQRLKDVRDDGPKEATTRSGIKLEASDDAFVKFTNVERIRQEERQAAEKKKAEEKVEAEKRRKDALSH